MTSLFFWRDHVFSIECESRIASRKGGAIGGGKVDDRPFGILGRRRNDCVYGNGGGPVPIVVMRNTWDVEKMTYVGLKGGSPGGPHGHMDGGSFILDAGKVRWACDLGAEGYHRVESMGLNLWSAAQDSDRWKLFRLNNKSHNTLVIDDHSQIVRGFATFTEVSESMRTKANS